MSADDWGIVSSVRWDQPAADPLEDIRRAAEMIRNQPYRPHPCSAGKHVVASRALTCPGTYLCVNCGCPVEIPYPLCER